MPVCRATETNLRRGMTKTVLITGGAGFIASHCAALLLQQNYQVKALDNLDAQIHGSERRPPSYLDRRVELVVGDIRSPKAVRRALADVDFVIHLAARVGVGQGAAYRLWRSDIADHQLHPAVKIARGTTLAAVNLRVEIVERFHLIVLLKQQCGAMGRDKD